MAASSDYAFVRLADLICTGWTDPQRVHGNHGRAAAVTMRVWQTRVATSVQPKNITFAGCPQMSTSTTSPATDILCSELYARRGRLQQAIHGSGDVATLESLLREVDAALERIAAGDYGLCKRAASRSNPSVCWPTRWSGCAWITSLPPNSAFSKTISTWPPGSRLACCRHAISFTADGKPHMRITPMAL